MSGSPESLLERIVKPVRINLVAAGLAVVGGGAAVLLIENANIVIKATAYLLGVASGSGIGCYARSVMNYHRDRVVLRELWFEKSYAALSMKHYCHRQAFLVASIEEGFRDEANTLIKNTPRGEKQLHWLPCI